MNGTSAAVPQTVHAAAYIWRGGRSRGGSSLRTGGAAAARSDCTRRFAARQRRQRFGDANPRASKCCCSATENSNALPHSAQINDRDSNLDLLRASAFRNLRT